MADLVNLALSKTINICLICVLHFLVVLDAILSLRENRKLQIILIEKGLFIEGLKAFKANIIRINKIAVRKMKLLGHFRINQQHRISVISQQLMNK